MLRKKIILFSTCILTSSFLFSQTSKIKELESQRLKLKNEIKEINSLLIDNSKKTKMAYGDLENISIKINRNQDLIKITNDQEPKKEPSKQEISPQIQKTLERLLGVLSVLMLCLEDLNFYTCIGL